MKSIGSLHEENLLEIFRCLESSTPWLWLSCKLVCKEWSRLADLALVHLQLRGGRQISSALLLRRIPAFNQLRTLSLLPHALTEVPHIFFAVVGSSCPILESIDIHHLCPELTEGMLAALFSNCTELSSISLTAPTSTISLPQSLGNLKKLQRLHLQCEAIIAPHSFSSLSELQDLRMAASVADVAPGFPWGLPGLLCLAVPYGIVELDASHGRVSRLQELVLTSPGETKEKSVKETFVTGLENLKSLELEMDQEEDLTSLLELPWNTLKNLETLSLSLSDVCSEDLETLGGWKGLRSVKVMCEMLVLNIDSDEDANEEEVIEEWLRSVRPTLTQVTRFHLRVYSLEHWNGKLPFTNLTELRLEDVGDDELYSELLQDLGNLQHLYLTHIRNLKRLWRMDSLESLRTLSIEKCRKLRRLPKLGMAMNLSSLILKHNDVLELSVMNYESFATVRTSCIEDCPKILPKEDCHFV